LLIDGGSIEFKTDNEGLYFYSLQSLDLSKHFKIIYQTQNLYLNKKELVSNIQTEYEKKFVALNKPIYKIFIKSD
jgi:tRNA (guanine-N7-)-methyltransferase